MMAPDRRGKHLLMEPKSASANFFLVLDMESSWTPANGAQVAVGELLTDYNRKTLTFFSPLRSSTPSIYQFSRFWSSFLYFLKNLSSKFQPTTFLTFRAFFTDDLGHHFQIALDQIFPGRIEVAAAVFSLQIRISNENLLKNPAIVVLIAKFRGNS